MVPVPFRSLRALRILNVAAVGLSLAAVVSALFAGFFDGLSWVVLATGLPTWLLGTLWAWVLRWPKTVGKSSFRWGWAASVPLAMLNGALACGFVMGETQGPSGLLVGGILGATFGSIAWIPGLIVTLVCFGIPIASAQRLAKKGLAGEERGERIVGLACLAMSLLGLLLASLRPPSASSAGLPLAYAFALLGLLAGGASTVLALAREARRRAFVADADAGKIPGYRIDATDEGKVLVRIVSQGEGYRVADFEEEIFDLGAEGEATRPRSLEAVRRH